MLGKQAIGCTPDRSSSSNFLTFMLEQQQCVQDRHTWHRLLAANMLAGVSATLLSSHTPKPGDVIPTPWQALFTHQRMALGVLLAALVHLDSRKVDLGQGAGSFLEVYLAAARRASNTTGHRAEVEQSLARLGGYHAQVCE